MILMSGYHLGEIPFKTVYLHGLVRDTKGKKMSKSLGNIIDPLDMIEKYGADATRLSLIIGAPPGNDMRLSEDKVRGYKHFANKIWNISRFVLENTKDINPNYKLSSLNEKDKKLLNDLQNTAEEITKDLEKYQLYLAAEKLYHYLWHEFADVILEESKPILNESDSKIRESRQIFLYEALTTSLKLLHPFMPFVTEEIWQSLPQKDNEFLITAKWPTE
jgi:valyl-tRNA synthetase